MPIFLKISFVLALAAHGADLASTENCLGRGVCRELNPWLARFNQPAAFGAAQIGVAATSEWGVYELAHTHPKLALVTNLAITAAFTGIAVHNARATAALPASHP